LIPGANIPNATGALTTFLSPWLQVLQRRNIHVKWRVNRPSVEHCLACEADSGRHPGILILWHFSSRKTPALFPSCVIPDPGIRLHQLSLFM
jgi:hypothetical protein